MTSGPVGTQEQHHRELARLAVAQGRVPLVFLTHDEGVAFEEGKLKKLLRRYLVHNTNDNFVVFVAVNDLHSQQEGSKVIGIMIVGPFFSLRDPLYANLSPWSPTEYKGLLEDRRALMNATLKESAVAKCWGSLYFSPLHCKLPSYAFQVQMLYVLPQSLHTRLELETNVVSLLSNGFIPNGGPNKQINKLLLGIATLLERDNYNKRETRPFDAAFGPVEPPLSPLGLENFNLLFFGGAPSTPSKTFARSMPTILDDEFLPLVPSKDLSLHLGSVRLASRHSQANCAFLLEYLRSKAREFSGGKDLDGNVPISFWFGSAVCEVVNYGHRLSMSDVQPPDVVMASLMLLAVQEANRGLIPLTPFQVNAVQVHILPKPHNIASVKVDFSFDDGFRKHSIFSDIQRVILVVFDTVEGEPPSAGTPSDGESTAGGYTIPLKAPPPPPKVELLFEGVQKFAVGSGELLVLGGDVASKGFKILAGKKPLGVRGVFIFHMWNSATLVHTNRCLKRAAEEMIRPTVDC